MISSAVFELLKVFFPHKEQKQIDEKKLAANKKKYALYEGLSIFPLFLFLGVIACLVYLIGNFIIDMLPQDKSAVLAYRPESLVWLLPGLLLAFGLIFYPMEWLYKALLKDEYDLYLEYTNRKHGWDGMRIARPVLGIFFMTGVLSFFLLLNTSLILTGEKIIVNGFFSVKSSEYLISDIAKITHFDKVKAPNGDIVTREYFLIYYKDGEIIWDTGNGILETDQHLIDYLLEKNHMKLTFEVMELGE